MTIAPGSVYSAPNCPFCLANGRAEATAISSCGRYYLSKDIGNNEHYLVIPVAHKQDILELDDDWFGALKELVPRIPWYTSGVDGMNISINQGRRAGQRVQHLHWWVMYRDGSGGELGLAGLIKEYDRLTQS